MITFRAVDMVDMDRIMEIEATFGVEGWSRAFLEEFVDDIHSAFMAILEHGTIVGYYLMSGLGSDDGQCSMDSICVDGAMTGKGLGKIMLDHAVQLSKLHGATWMTLEVSENNKARYFWTANGFVEYAPPLAEYYNDGSAALRMSLTY